MTKHPIRKMFGLTVLYICIIFGIFFIQFRKDSVITKIIGAFQLTLSETADENGQTVLKNSFQLSSGGINFYTNQTEHVMLTAGGKQEMLLLTGWEASEAGDELTLFFTNDVSLTWKTENPEDVPFSIHAELPENTEMLSIPYKLNTIYTANEQTGNTITLISKTAQFELAAYALNDSECILTPAVANVTCKYWQEEHIFTFQDIVDYELASAAVYNDTIQQVRASMSNAFPSAGFTSASEHAIIAWVSELASQGRLSQALEMIPDSVKNGKTRTYFSAPYFNTLSVVYPTLTAQIAETASDIRSALITSDVSIFQNEKLTLYIITQAQSDSEALLTMAANLPAETFTLKTAGALLKLYADIYPYRPELAEKLVPCLETCAAYIEQHSIPQETSLQLVENDEILSAYDTAKVGVGLAKAATIRNNELYQKAGWLIANSALSAVYTFDADSLAAVYDMFAADNTDYPHIILLDKNAEEPVWAWTVAKDMTYTTTEDTVAFTANYNINGTHYMIVNGIKPFNSIQIYNIFYRTDPRFESYNSSGYVYNADNNAILLKYRHRSESELITLYY